MKTSDLLLIALIGVGAYMIYKRKQTADVTTAPEDYVAEDRTLQEEIIYKDGAEDVEPADQMPIITPGVQDRPAVSTDDDRKPIVINTNDHIKPRR